MVTPAGVWESRRLPGSGAGPSPDRLVIGSEGILGVITEAWMRIQARPRFRASAGVVFDGMAAASEGARPHRPGQAMAGPTCGCWTRPKRKTSPGWTDSRRC